jgi:hypothetical protein
VAVSVGWIFFRASSLSDAGYILSQLGQLYSLSISSLTAQSLAELTQHTSLGAISLAVIATLVLVFLLLEYSGAGEYFLRTKPEHILGTRRLVLGDVLLLLLVLLGDWAGTAFIYYQF